MEKQADGVSLYQCELLIHHCMWWSLLALCLQVCLSLPPMAASSAFPPLPCFKHFPAWGLCAGGTPPGISHLPTWHLSYSASSHLLSEAFREPLSAQASPVISHLQSLESSHHELQGQMVWLHFLHSYWFSSHSLGPSQHGQPSTDPHTHEHLTHLTTLVFLPKSPLQAYSTQPPLRLCSDVTACWWLPQPLLQTFPVSTLWALSSCYFPSWLLSLLKCLLHFTF